MSDALRPSLAAALMRLFPDLPAWALAPFVGGELLPIPFTADNPVHCFISTDPTRTRPGALRNDHWGSWGVAFTRRAPGAPITAEWLVRGVPCAFPFGAGVATVESTRAAAAAHADPGCRWRREVTARHPTILRFYEQPAQQDLYSRWLAIPDHAAQQEIATFWLGHTAPALAELGLAALRAPERHAAYL